MSDKLNPNFSRTKGKKPCMLDKELNLKLDLKEFSNPSSSRGFTSKKGVNYISCHTDRCSSSSRNQYDPKCHLGSLTKTSWRSKGPIIKAQEDFDNFYNSITPSLRWKLNKQETPEILNFGHKPSILNPNFIPSEPSASSKLKELLPFGTLKKIKNIIKINEINEDEDYIQELKDFAFEVLSQTTKKDMKKD
ncbi:unnamed protein product [Blepharisma stoltei]|uniref:Uncharacterized protein n=1 Tax=Blepharisma stoltei TaxID=1481888 RepID=A0AAU9ICL7_9CILI|nr:unnamed protein product [Blepharisma stoltei]